MENYLIGFELGVEPWLNRAARSGQPLRRHHLLQAIYSLLGDSFRRSTSLEPRAKDF